MALSPKEVFSALLGRDTTTTAQQIVRFTRLPRTCGALLAGAALAVSGVIIQQVLAQAGNALTGGNAGGSEIASSEAVAQMLDSMPLRGIVNFGGPAAAGMITPLLEILRAAIQ